MISLLLKGQAVAIGVLVLGLVGMCRSRDSAIADKARAEVLYRQADSALKANKAKVIKAETTVVRDIRTVTQLLTQREQDTLWRRDTIYLPGDTTPRFAVPIKTVAQQDTTDRSCKLLALSCDDFRAQATNRFADYERKLAVQPAFVARSCVTPSLLSGVLGAAVGVVVGRTALRPQ